MTKVWDFHRSDHEESYELRVSIVKAETSFLRQGDCRGGKEGRLEYGLNRWHDEHFQFFKNRLALFCHFMHGFPTGGSSVMLIPGDLPENFTIPQQPGIAAGQFSLCIECFVFFVVWILDI